MELSAALDRLRPSTKGVLVTQRSDGRPQLSNIAYKLGDDGIMRISVTASRAKTKNAARDPRVSLYWTADDFWSYVVVDGQASLSPVAAAPDDDTVEQLVALYRSFGNEHPDWDDYRRAMVADGRLVLSITPERAYGMAAGS